MGWTAAGDVRPASPTRFAFEPVLRASMGEGRYFVRAVHATAVLLAATACAVGMTVAVARPAATATLPRIDLKVPAQCQQAEQPTTPPVESSTEPKTSQSAPAQPATGSELSPSVPAQSTPLVNGGPA